MAAEKVDIECRIVDVSDIPLDQLRASDDSALMAAILRIAKEAAEPTSIAAAFMNRRGGGI
ncbi:hypothetical protein Nm8I071_23070 [Nonomuraea sp. TT08I-71]|nr:hypothetical protein Nm8I071_23070 [Nonomuraea sp. TT08I-71]